MRVPLPRAWGVAVLMVLSCEKPKTSRPITKEDCKDWAFAIGLLIRDKNPTLDSCFRCDSPKKRDDCRDFLAWQSTQEMCDPYVGKTVSIAQGDCLKTATTAADVSKCKPTDKVFVEMMTNGSLKTCM